jgi:dihydroorotate dehydrogenase
MPDWFYRTVSRPLLFRLPAAAARDLALGVVGTLARLPGGGAVIDYLGHMRPPAFLRRTVLGVTFPSPVGLAPGLDGRAAALAALARFGVGFLEVGPVTLRPHNANPAVARRVAEQALWYPDPPAALGADDLARRLPSGTLPVPLIVRLSYTPGTHPDQAAAECRELIKRFTPFVALFSLTIPEPARTGAWSAPQWREYITAVQQTAGAVPRPLLLCVPADLDDTALDTLVAPALEAGVGGVLIDGSVVDSSGGRLVGAPARAAALELVGRLRQRWGKQLAVIAAGGVHEPEHAMALLTAGADLVQIDAGLVYSGPGLPKRVNEALLRAAGPPAPAPDEPPRPPELSWFWTALMGLGMLIGAVLALVVAATRLVLPYDEAFSGMTREHLAAINDRLLAFMAHDRVSLAGTMIALGVLYVGLALGGVRRGLHWAQVTVFASAFVGFGTFFLFLGFGYFDPFHAFVTAILFQFLLLGLHARLGPVTETGPTELREDWRWRLSQWGQLAFVLQGCGLLGAGVVITSIGCTSVFVHEDLEFMDTTAAALAAANPRLVPLVAHDRATFGGMLIACGIVVLQSALWGFRAGRTWLWWTLLAAGVPAYAAAIGVHLVVGYTDLMHLTPAFTGAGLFALGLALSRPYLCHSEHEYGVVSS